MIDLNFLDCWLEVERMFPPQVRAVFAECAKTDGDAAALKFYADFEEFFTRALNRASPWRFAGGAIGPCDTLSRKRANALEFIRNLAVWLQNEPPMLLPFEFTGPALTVETAQGDALRILEAVVECGNEWELRETVATANRWVPEAVARMNQPTTLYRLENKHSGSYVHFYVVGFYRVHVLVFHVSPASEGRFWTVRRDIKSLFQVVLKAGFDKMTAEVLTDTKGMPLSAPEREWRLEPVTAGGEQFTRLGLFWRRLGWVPYVGMLRDNPTAVLMVAPELTGELKEQFVRAGLPNPYRHLSRSVYGPDLERELRGDTPSSPCAGK